MNYILKYKRKILVIFFISSKFYHCIYLRKSLCFYNFYTFSVLYIFNTFQELFKNNILQTVVYLRTKRIYIKVE